MNDDRLDDLLIDFEDAVRSLATVSVGMPDKYEREARTEARRAIRDYVAGLNPPTSDCGSDAATLRRLVKASEVILGLWFETELDPEDEDYETFMAAFNESVTGYLAEARAALAESVPARGDAQEIHHFDPGARAAASEDKRG